MRGGGGKPRDQLRGLPSPVGMMKKAKGLMANCQKGASMKNLPTLVGNWGQKPTGTTRSIDEKTPNPVGKLRRKIERSLAHSSS